METLARLGRGISAAHSGRFARRPIVQGDARHRLMVSSVVPDGLALCDVP